MPAMTALAGYRVLELAHLIAGPVCGLYLADMGADVIKVEHPVGGDASRTSYGAHLNDESAVFVTVNRNKRSVALDLSRAEGQAVFARLVRGADMSSRRTAVVSPSASASTTRACAAESPPRLLLGLRLWLRGPWRENRGLDMLVQAMGVSMSVMGEADRPPVLCGAPCSTPSAPSWRARHRHRPPAPRATGEGQRVDVSL